MTSFLEEALARYPRIAIAGGPRVGKTTLTQSITDRPVIHTDDYMHTGDWESQPYMVINACKGLARFVVEGVQVPRSLRKGLEVDAVVWLDQALTPRNHRQEAMAKGVLSVFVGWRAQAPQVPIVFVPPGQVRALKRNTMGDK